MQDVQKKRPLFIFVTTSSDVIEFFQFLAEICPREFETSTYAQQTVQVVIMWTAPLTDRSLTKIHIRFTAGKKSPDNVITQYVQISPISQ